MKTKQEWQGIATAPRDGTEILIGWYQSENIMSPDWRKVIGKKYTWVSCTAWGMKHDKEWHLVETGSYAQDSQPSEKPTHWYPLPSPPPAP